ncbi:MAG: aminotransferase, partial [Raoultibacter sp.]
MAAYAQRTKEELKALKAQLESEYAEFAAKGLKLNMARGKPAKAQLDL